MMYLPVQAYAIPDMADGPMPAILEFSFRPSASTIFEHRSKNTDSDWPVSRLSLFSIVKSSSI
jgi:hypothetical protein